MIGTLSIVAGPRGVMSVAIEMNLGSSKLILSLLLETRRQKDRRIWPYG